MQNIADISELVCPVTYRARAETVDIGFVDHFAKKVLYRLGIPKDKDYKPGSSYAMENHVRLSQQIDKIMLRFFTLNPKALGVEIDGGLSTRFHRLSEKTDWPRFSWCSINTADVTACLQSVFPKLDNHRYETCESPATQWNQYLTWQSPEPTIILLGEHKPCRNLQEIEGVLNTLSSSLNNTTPVIDLLICHSLTQSHETSLRSIPGVVTLSNKSFTPRKARFFAPCVARARRKKLAEKITILHVKVTKQCTQ